VPDAQTSLNEPLGPEETELGDCVADSAAADPVDLLERAERSADLHAAVSRLPRRQQFVIDSHFGLTGPPQTLETIGRSLGVTRERVRQIENDALRALRATLDHDRAYAA
jgi:RNA polymerase sigma factor (sigma-70 family)